MQTAETVLNIIRERGQHGLPLERLYRQLFNRDLYLRAYGKLYRNKGAMTPGATTETVDGMSLAKIDPTLWCASFSRAIMAQFKQPDFQPALDDTGKNWYFG